jgi:hypothetical protein
MAAAAIYHLIELRLEPASRGSPFVHAHAIRIAVRPCPQPTHVESDTVMVLGSKGPGGVSQLSPLW